MTFITTFSAVHAKIKLSETSQASRIRLGEKHHVLSHRHCFVLGSPSTFKKEISMSFAPLITYRSTFKLKTTTRLVPLKIILNTALLLGKETMECL